METNKIVINKRVVNPIGKNGTPVLITKKTATRLEALSDITGIPKRQIADYLLNQALNIVDLRQSEEGEL